MMYLYRSLPTGVALIFFMMGLFVNTAPSFNRIGVSQAYACGCGICCTAISVCASACQCTSNKQRPKTTDHISQAFELHRTWMTDVLFGNKDRGVNSVSGDEEIRDKNAGLLEMLNLATGQLTTAAVNQVMMIGTLLDAKHQLETQRIFQTMTAQAHKDYHPSEALCQVGTQARSLSGSARKSDLAQTALAARMSARLSLSGDVVSMQGQESDFWSRLNQFVDTYCNKKDNGNGLENLCKGSEADPKRYNKDIHFAHTFDTPLTLELDFTPDQTDLSEDEEDILALSANLYAHKPFPNMNAEYLLNRKKKPTDNALVLMDARALNAKRSVAQNSFASIAALKAEGDENGKEFVYAALKQLSNDVLSDEEIVKLLGDKPGYYAQMDILAKKIYQDPSFYADIIDKPANVHRREVAVQAIELMQKRDIYRSLLRSEAMYAVMLESALTDQQRDVSEKLRSISQRGTSR